MAPVALSWILEQNDFSNSESLCHCDAPHQVLAKSDLRHGRRCCWKNYKMAAMGPSWIWNRIINIIAILILYVAPMPPIKFLLNVTYGLGDVI